ALEITPSSTKALYRRSQARLKLVDLEGALKDIQKAVELDSKDGKEADVALKVQEREVRKEMKKWEEKEKKVFERMFR
ncbi:hypothetical protein HDV05_001010, partial [Chytridiales sp. JEL 0842]